MVETSLAPACLRPGLRVYAVGDVHGCFLQLQALHGAIAQDLRARPVGESVLVHVGDYVDRGPDSASVVALLGGGLLPPVTRRADLLGNHETMMLAALSGDTGAAALWVENGGDATLASYGVPPGTPPEDWARRVPAADRRWLRTRPLTHQEGGYLFVHAGIRPGRPLFRQSEEDLLWIRGPFLSSREQHPLVIVHGHTPSPAPQIRPNRIGIDTGAAMGGCLTSLVLQDDRLSFLQA